VRLFVPRRRLAGPTLPFLADDRRYLLRVRRLRAGDSFEVFDGEGGRYPARVDEEMDSATLGPREADAPAAGLRVELWPGIPRSNKLDLIVQKATELGVARIVPLLTHRSVARVSAERLSGRMQRWRRIAAEAARQCGRADVPDVSEPRDLASFLKRAEEGAAGLVYEGRSETSLRGFLAALPKDGGVALAVGPEGGFEPSEVDLADAAGVPLLSLGSRILRAETAAIVACALAQAASGGFD
jgi:16S rRNA (uracil1498-N3)-methyltransferase